ncbi:unnamed protein product, partial [Durusdinium trenchii]
PCTTAAHLIPSSSAPSQAAGSGSSSGGTFSRCANPDCPCTSSFSGLQGDFCCMSCHGGVPCQRNVHNAPQAPPANQCAAGCGRPSFNGQAGQFCGLTCRQKFAKPTPTVRASQPSKRGPDVLAMGGKGQTFEAWHGTSRTNALQIKSSGCFRVDTPADGCLGKGAYFAGRRKAERFAHDFGQGQPALVRCSITVQNPCYVDGDDRSWQARGFDSCRATSATTRSTSF